MRNLTRCSPVRAVRSTASARCDGDAGRAAGSFAVLRLVLDHSVSTVVNMCDEAAGPAELYRISHVNEHRFPTVEPPGEAGVRERWWLESVAVWPGGLVDGETAPAMHHASTPCPTPAYGPAARPCAIACAAGPQVDFETPSVTVLNSVALVIGVAMRVGTGCYVHCTASKGRSTCAVQARARAPPHRHRFSASRIQPTLQPWLTRELRPQMVAFLTAARRLSPLQARAPLQAQLLVWRRRPHVPDPVERGTAVGHVTGGPAQSALI